MSLARNEALQFVRPIQDHVQLRDGIDLPSRLEHEETLTIRGYVPSLSPEIGSREECCRLRRHDRGTFDCDRSHHEIATRPAHKEQFLAILSPPGLDSAARGN